MPMQPLEGLLVLDFTTLLPGPMATLLLAEAGAEVVKIERPAGEEMRSYRPKYGASANGPANRSATHSCASAAISSRSPSQSR